MLYNVVGKLQVTPLYVVNKMIRIGFSSEDQGHQNLDIGSRSSKDFSIYGMHIEKIGITSHVCTRVFIDEIDTFDDLQEMCHK